MLQLEKLSKSDLIWVIRAMEKGKTLERALIQLEQNKQTEAFDRADALYQQAAEKRKEYIDMVKEYYGKPINDIPNDTMLKATRLLDDAKRLEREADKLYGIKC